MFDQLKNFFAGLGASASGQRDDNFLPDDVRLSAAALMYHVIQADGVLREVERERLHRLLSEEHGLEGAKLEALVAAAREADGEAVDLYRFTSVLMRDLDHAARVNFIELLWELVYADGERHELEDNVVWRIAELIAVERADRIAARQRVNARHGNLSSDPDFEGD